MLITYWDFQFHLYGVCKNLQGSFWASQKHAGSTIRRGIICLSRKQINVTCTGGTSQGGSGGCKLGVKSNTPALLELSQSASDLTHLRWLHGHTGIAHIPKVMYNAPCGYTLQHSWLHLIKMNIHKIHNVFLFIFVARYRQ